MDIITKLASFQASELLILAEQASKGLAVADFKSRTINIEIYRRYSLGLKQISPSWITKNLHVTFPTANRLIDNLVKKGFIHKRDDKFDKRVVRLHVTNLAIVRMEQYLATILLGMHTIGVFKLNKNDKKELKNLIIQDSKSSPLLNSLSPDKLKIITGLWSSLD